MEVCVCARVCVRESEYEICSSVRVRERDRESGGKNVNEVDDYSTNNANY